MAQVCVFKVEIEKLRDYCLSNDGRTYAEQKEPFELFLNVGKAGSDIAADAEAIGRLCSMLLRIPSQIPEDELKQVLCQGDHTNRVGLPSPHHLGSPMDQ